ncbi:MAG: ABC transporter permease [Rhizobiales bacterium]|nr:ABC transporter permease [Hyphomicrobiales bacterium]
MSVTAAMPTDVPRAPQSPGAVALRRLLRHGNFRIGGTILGLIILAAIVGPWLWPLDPASQDLGHRLAVPVWSAKGTWLHPFGTDQLGRDYLARLLQGARVSLTIGFLTVLLSGVIGTGLGVAAGYFGGRIDVAINFLITIRLTLPVVLVALVVVAVYGGSLPTLIVVIGLLLWDRFAVVTRSATQQLASRDFIISAQAIGSSIPRILFVELLPNLIGPLVVVATIELAHAVLLEAALSFLGLGVKPPLSSWGLMVAEAKNQLLFRPWMIAIPGTPLVALVLAINLVGDAIRDAVAADGRA